MISPGLFSMNNICRVLPLSVRDVLKQSYDLQIAALGYESRSRFFCENHCVSAERRFVSGFGTNQILSYNQNLTFYQSRGFQVAQDDLRTFAQRVSELLEEAVARGGGTCRVCVDVSSMSRAMMAAIVGAVAAMELRAELQLDFVYCIAEYSPPPEVQATIHSAGPINSQFSGWTTAPELPTCAVFGVGYEPDRVIGTIEYIEPGQVWAYVPRGPDERYLEAVSEVNSTLWGEIPEDCLVEYDLDEPFNTFVRLESLCFSIMQDCRMILIPFGPKIFAVICLLVSVVHDPNIAVWRVSGDRFEEPAERRASGDVFCLRAVFVPRAKHE